ncbi:MAG TPA: winged helix-turn-helix domain-containing protein [Acidobacteriaceae bacterium]|nr:winged helix-turn-helix domain-containing protein [Acidobacteriaceae bacterium]
MLNSSINGEARAKNGSGNGSNTIRFGVFEADLHSGEVRKSGSRIKLQDQPFKVLQILLERPGSLVTREELQNRIWPEESYGDFDHAVNVAVGKLRTALGDSADNPCFIETVPRRGYRFVARLENPVVETPPAEPPTVVVPEKQRISGKHLAWLAAILLICGGLVAFGVWLGKRSVSTKPLDFQRLTVRHGTIFSARFAPDGRNVLYGASWDGMPINIFSTDLKIPGARDVGIHASQLLAVSSTGEMAILQSLNSAFMFTNRGTLAQVPLTGGSPRQIAENVTGADWAPDGKTLAIVRDMGGTERLEFPIGHVLYETFGWISAPRISPNGNYVAFLDHATHDDDRGVVSVVDLAGHKKVLSSGWESEQGLAWSPNGSEVWFSATQAGLQRRIYAVDLDGHQRLAFRAPGGVTLQDIAPDGRVLLTRDEQRAGILAMAAGATRLKDLSWLDWSLPVDLSHDGNTLLFDEQGEEGGPTYTVAVRDMQGSPPIPLGEGMAGTFSPDGKWVITTVAYTQLELLPTGAGTIKKLERGNIQQYRHGMEWMPDGKQIVFSGNEAGHPARCYIQNIDGGKPRPLTPEGVSGCMVSPDGQWVAAGGHSDGGPKLYPLDGGAPRSMVGLLPGEGFTWSTDPQVVYAYLEKTAPVKIYRLNILTGKREMFKEINPSDETGLCDMTHVMFSPNGQSYVFGYTRLLSELYLVSGMK